METIFTDDKVEIMATQAIEIIKDTRVKTSFILRKKMNASSLIKELTGEKIDIQEQIYYFWNIVGGSLAYVKPETLIY